MIKALLAAAAAMSFVGIAACTQGPNEEAGEKADTAYEQSTTGQTEMGQGPMEEAGEHADEATGGATTTTPPADGATTTTPPTP